MPAGINSKSVLTIRHRSACRHCDVKPTVDSGGVAPPPMMLCRQQQGAWCLMSAEALWFLSPQLQTKKLRRTCHGHLWSSMHLQLQSPALPRHPNTVMGQGHSFQFSFSSLRYPVFSCNALRSLKLVNPTSQGSDGLKCGLRGSCTCKTHACAQEQAADTCCSRTALLVTWSGEAQASVCLLPAMLKHPTGDARN